MNQFNNNEKAAAAELGITRRRFVQGAALIGAAAAAGVRPGFAAGSTGLRMPEVSTGH